MFSRTISSYSWYMFSKTDGMRKTFVILLLIMCVVMIPASCSVSYRARVLNRQMPDAGVMIRQSELAHMESATRRDTSEDGMMNTDTLDRAGSPFGKTRLLDAAYVVARHKQVSERHGCVELEFDIVVPDIMTDPSWQVRITPVITILGKSEELDSLLITGNGYLQAQRRGYDKYERYVSSLLPLDSEELYLYKRSLGLFLERFAAAPFGVSEEEAVRHYTKQWLKRLNLIRHSRKDRKYERFVKSPYINGGVRIDTIIDRAGESVVYRYFQTINTAPKMKRIDLNLKSSIVHDGRTLYSHTNMDTARFYISSLSSLADNRERYVWRISTRDSIINTEADILFEKDKEYFVDEIAGNAAEFRRIERMMLSIFEDDRLVTDSIIIRGAASPEGDYNYNKRLSGARAEFVLGKIRALVQKYRRDGVHISYTSLGENSLIDTTENLSPVHAAPFDYQKLYDNIKAYGIGEDWAGFEAALIEAGCFDERQKNEILLCVLAKDPEERERKMKALPYYENISDSVFSKIRNVRFEFHLHKKDAINDTIKTAEIDTVYMKGLLYLRERDYKNALEALKKYRDYNSALAYLLMEYNHTALEILKGLERTASRDYLLAIAYSRTGNTEEAVKFLDSAISLDDRFGYRYRLDPECAKLKMKL